MGDILPRRGVARNSTDSNTLGGAGCLVHQPLPLGCNADVEITLPEKIKEDVVCGVMSLQGRDALPRNPLRPADNNRSPGIIVLPMRCEVDRGVAVPCGPGYKQSMSSAREIKRDEPASLLTQILLQRAFDELVFCLCALRPRVILGKVGDLNNVVNGDVCSARTGFEGGNVVAESSD